MNPSQYCRAAQQLEAASKTPLDAEKAAALHRRCQNTTGPYGSRYCGCPCHPTPMELDRRELKRAENRVNNRKKREERHQKTLEDRQDALEQLKEALLDAGADPHRSGQVFLVRVGTRLFWTGSDLAEIRAVYPSAKVIKAKTLEIERSLGLKYYFKDGLR